MCWCTFGDDLIQQWLPQTPQVRFTPTVEHCSMATLIGLCIRVKLLRALPPRFKVRWGASIGDVAL